MKRLFNVIFIALFSLLFFMVFLIYREQDLSNIYNLFGLANQYENGDIYFPNPLSEEEQNQVIERVELLTEENEVIIVFTHYEGPIEKIDHFQHYVSGKDELIQQMVPASVNIPNDFSKNSSYLTTDAKDVNEAALPFFSFYQDGTYSIYPVSALKDNLTAMRFGFTYYFEDSADKTYYEQVFSSAFDDFNAELNTVSHNAYDSDQALIDDTVYISVIMLALSMTFMLFQISNGLNEIAILKLNGYRLKDILLYLFKENLILVSMFAVGIPSFLTLLFFQTVNERVVQFLIQVLSISLLLVCIYILIVILSLLIIRFVRLSDLLKNKNINQLLTYFTYGALILTSIFVLPIIQTSIQELATAVPYYLEQQTAFKEIGDIHTIEDMDDPERKWEFNQIDYGAGVYNERNEKHAEIYQNLEGMNSFYRMSLNAIGGGDWEDQTIYLLYQVNQKYFEEQAFYMNGEQIQVQDKEAINVLIDRETAQKEDWQVDSFTRLLDVEVTIYLFDEVDFLSYNQEDMQRFDNVRAPIFVYSTHPEAFEPNISAGGIYFDGEQMEETENYLNAVGIGEYLIFRSSKEEQELLNEQFLYFLRMQSMRFLPGLLSLIVLLVAFRKFVWLANQKKWQVLKSVGFRVFDLTKGYLVQLILLNIIVLVTQYFFMDTILWLIVGLLMLLSLCSYLLMNRASRQVTIN